MDRRGFLTTVGTSTLFLAGCANSGADPNPVPSETSQPSSTDASQESPATAVASSDSSTPSTESAASSDTPSTITTQPDAGSHAWPMYHRGPAHTGYAPQRTGVVSPPVEAVWSQSLGRHANEFDGMVANQDRLFVSGADLNGELRCFTAETGELEWTYEGRVLRPAVSWRTVVVPEQYPTIAGPGGESDGRPNALTALDTVTGEIQWRRETTEDWTHGGPTISDDVAYLTTGNADLLAVGIDSGTELWRFTPQSGSVRKSSPTVVDGTVYYAPSNRLFSVDARTGDRQWVRPLPGEVFGSVGFKAGMIHVGAGQSQLAINPTTGEEQWRFTGADDLGSPAIADGTVYATAYSTLYALDMATGEEQWRFVADDDFGGLWDPVVTGDTVYVSPHGNLIAVDASTGDERWRKSMQDFLVKPIIGHGRVYAVDGHGLHALE